jgi:hypothetical protein
MMDDRRFDALVRSMASGTSRRQVLNDCWVWVAAH